MHRESKEPTPELRGHNYLARGPPANWEAIALAQLHGGLQQLEARHQEARADPGPANEAGVPQEAADDSETLLAALSRGSSYVSGAMDRLARRLGILSSPGGESREFLTKRIHLALKFVELVEYRTSDRVGKRSCSRRHETEGQGSVRRRQL